MRKTMWITLVLAVAGALYLSQRPADKMGGPRKRFTPIPDSALDPAALAAVETDYHKAVEPLLNRACMDCHSSKTDFPWYHSVPGVRQYLDGHIQEGRERLDLTDGFPFKGKAPIIFRIRGIGRDVKEGKMPLWDYRLMHPKARLTGEEKETIVAWSEASFQKLSETAKPYEVSQAGWGSGPKK
jgi:hypothetical protein